MILEGIVTTIDDGGLLNVAPMGPDVGEGSEEFLLRPFRGSRTHGNLKETGEGVFHVTDDALLLARAAIGAVVSVSTIPASIVRGEVLVDACRYREFRVLDFDDSEERARVRVATVAEGTLREFFGWNRAKHAVVEAAILATRVGILSTEEILAEFGRLSSPVVKTGGERELAAFRLLEAHVRAVADSRTPRGASEAPE